MANQGNEPNFLYRNSGNGNAWIKVRCGGTVSNRSAIGTKVRLKATIKGKPVEQLREMTGGDGRSGQTLVAHFGLGDATIIDALRIEWPSGIVQELHEVAPRQFLTADGRWAYTSDAENRRVQMVRDTDSPSGARQRLVFEYDHQGRRIRKTFSTYSGGWQHQLGVFFLNDPRIPVRGTGRQDNRRHGGWGKGPARAERRSDLPGKSVAYILPTQHTLKCCRSRRRERE